MSNPGRFNVAAGSDPLALTDDDRAWLDQSGRMVRVVYLTKDRRTHVRAQGIGIPKAAIVLGKSRNAERLPIPEPHPSRCCVAQEPCEAHRAMFARGMTIELVHAAEGARAWWIKIAGTCVVRLELSGVPLSPRACATEVRMVAAQALAEMTEHALIVGAT